MFSAKIDSRGDWFIYNSESKSMVVRSSSKESAERLAERLNSEFYYENQTSAAV